MKDLISRLRYGMSDKDGGIGLEAADALEAQAKMVDRFTAHELRLVNHIQTIELEIKRLLAQVAALTKERDHFEEIHAKAVRRHVDAERQIANLKQENSDLAKAAIVPDGMVLAPREPTEVMVEACCNSMDRGFAFEYIANAYKAMLEAANDEKSWN